MGRRRRLPPPVAACLCGLLPRCAVPCINPLGFSCPPLTLLPPQRVRARAPAERCGARARRRVARGGQQRVPGAGSGPPWTGEHACQSIACCCVMCCSANLDPSGTWRFSAGNAPSQDQPAPSPSRPQVDSSSEGRVSDTTYKLDAIFDGSQPTSDVYTRTAQGLIHQAGAGVGGAGRAGSRAARKQGSRAAWKQGSVEAPEHRPRCCEGAAAVLQMRPSAALLLPHPVCRWSTASTRPCLPMARRLRARCAAGAAAALL